jgi:O-antigen ligase
MMRQLDRLPGREDIRDRRLMTVGNRRLVAATAVVLGVVLAALLLLLRVSPGLTLVPLGLGALVALVLVPFPEADTWLALALIGTFPLLPPSPLPNLPLSAAVLGVAAVRLWRADAGRVVRGAWLVLAALWVPLLVGAALSRWPAPSVWFRPATLLAFAALASLVGVMVWSDSERRERWIDGLAAGMVIVTASAIVVFAAQYLFPISGVVDAVVNVVGYVRGDAAAAKFTDQNNWVIYGRGLTLRAVSPLFPAPNNVGGYLGALGPVMAAGWLATSRRGSRLLRLVALVLATIALLLTISRSSWLGAVAAFVVVAALALSRSEVRRRIVRANAKRLAGAALVIALAGIIGVAGILTVSHQGVQDRLTKPLDDPSVTTRLVIDQDALAAFQADLVRGAGLGNWESSFPVKTGRAYVHNVFLEYGLAAGVLGGVWALLLVLIPLVAGARAALRGAIGSATIYGLGFAAMAIFTATQFLFDDNLLNPQYAWLLALFIGGAIANANRPRDQLPLPA